jgi:methyl-accepting chemotaxis protein
MKWSVGTKISAGFGITLIIFIVVGLIAWRSTVSLVDAAAWTRHTSDVQTQLDGIHTALREAELAQRNYLLTADAAYLDEYTSRQHEVERGMEQVRTLTADNPRQQARLARLEEPVKRRLAIASETIDLRRTQGLDGAIGLVKTGRGKAASEESLRILTEMRSDEAELLAQRRHETEQDARNAEASLVYGMIGALLLTVLAAIIITRNIAVPLRGITTAAERITIGDLSSTITTEKNREDEVGMLARAFERMTQFLRTMAGAAEQIAAGNLRTGVQPRSNDDMLGNAFVRMAENLRKQISAMAENAAVLGSVASEIVASTTQLVSGASESAAAVTQTTTTVEEIRQTAQMATQKSKMVSENAQKAVQISQDGRKSTADVISGMDRIRQQMEAIGESMMRLSEQGQTIGQIIATVEDLAAQSNLLAVNAAIEAAKAGEHGKGFGVVAQEVKSLAEQSRQATDRVRTILGDIQKATTAAVLATEQGGKAVEAGGQQTGGAAESIQMLAGTVAEAAQAATQIAASSQQQLVGMDQVAVAMESIKQTSAQNVASARQLDTAARNLNDLGQRLKQAVEQYAV